MRLETMRRLESPRGKVRLVKTNDAVKPFAIYFALPNEPVKLTRHTTFPEAVGAYYCHAGVINPLELSTPESMDRVAPENEKETHQ